MAPKERIRAIRLMERLCEQYEYFRKIGVDIEFRNVSAECNYDESDA